MPWLPVLVAQSRAPPVGNQTHSRWPNSPNHVGKTLNFMTQSSSFIRYMIYTSNKTWNIENSELMKDPCSGKYSNCTINCQNGLTVNSPNCVYKHSAPSILFPTFVCTLALYFCRVGSLHHQCARCFLHYLATTLHDSQHNFGGLLYICSFFIIIAFRCLWMHLFLGISNIKPIYTWNLDWNAVAELRVHTILWSTSARKTPLRVYF